MPNTEIEEKIGGIVAGVDEAGRGPWAGPVVASAVVFKLPIDNYLISNVNDSKKLSSKSRLSLFNFIIKIAEVGIGSAEVGEIDSINILQATHLAMLRAIKNLPNRPEVLLIDGNSGPNIDIKSQFIVKGDSISTSIAAASIIAKVSRDSTMIQLANNYPGYGFERHKGYGTLQHKEALEKLGPCSIHRKSFKPVKKFL